jgi:plasmid stabilization system protein ParE
MLPVVWLPEASTELNEAQAWYGSIGTDLGLRFALAVEEAVEIIAANPFRFAKMHGERRRAGVKRFPYGVFFQVEDNRIVVIACFHGRRNPKRWQTR